MIKPLFIYQGGLSDIPCESERVKIIIL